MIFGYQFSPIHTSVNIHIDIQAGISMQEHSAMDIRKQYMSMNEYLCFFMDISLHLSMFVWISIWTSLNFYGYPCTDLLWILDPGTVSWLIYCPGRLVLALQ